MLHIRKFSQRRIYDSTNIWCILLVGMASTTYVDIIEEILIVVICTP